MTPSGSLSGRRQLARRPELEVVEGVPHVWHWYGSFLAEARNSINRIGDFVRRHTTG